MNYNELKELLCADRSYRRFDNSYRITLDILEKLVDLTRYCASGRNLQPLRYRAVHNEGECNALFDTLKWAGYFSDWDGPSPSDRPSAYLVQCLDTDLTSNPLCDDGLQIQAITLGAVSEGLGCCVIKSFDVVKVRQALGIPDNMAPRYIIAIGKPVESVVIEDTDGRADADIKYYRTPEGVHHVPKRPLSELLIPAP